MVGKNQIKFIRSLQQKKYRNQNGLFVAEGIKLVDELIRSGIELSALYSTDLDIFNDPELNTQLISESELKKMSSLSTPNKVLAVFEKREPAQLDFSDWILALDRVQDPGNLGTIIRLCDWFGIGHLLCSEDTVDCFNPKVLQATMGSIARVNIVYASIQEVVKASELPLYGSLMDAESVYTHQFPSSGILLMGNESHGISPELQKMADQSISIPRFGNSETESLNVATATAVLLSEIRRTAIQK